MKSYLRAHLSCCVFALFLTALPSQLKALETVYVSTGAGQQILAFNDSGAVTGVCNLTFNSSGVTPEDVVVGPDGNLYVADTLGSRIFRVSPSSVATPFSPAGDCGAVAIYDQSATPNSCTTAAGQGNQTCPTGPEGPSFLRISTLDLYFNTHTTASGNAGGVWKIPGIANSGTNATCSTTSVPCPAPVQVLSSASSGEGSGEGLDFDIFGKLLAVDQTNGQVIRETVSCLTSGSNDASCFKSNFINGLTSPVGIGQNACGDILVTSGNAINRYSGTLGGNTPLDSRTFSGGNNTPRFLEVDSSGRIFVITAGDESGKNAILWRFDPPAGSPPTTVTTAKPCPLSKYTTAFSVAISKNLAAGIASSNGLGLGISASDATVTATFSSPTPQNPTANTNTYNFGQHSFTVTCNGISGPFNLSVTAVKSRPTDAPQPQVSFVNPQPGTQELPANPPLCPNAIVNPGCVHYGGEHGFCMQYVEQSAVDPNTICTASSPFTFLVLFDSAEPISNPGGAHVDSQNVTDPFQECQSQDFYSQLPTGDPVRLSGDNSKHVVFNSDLAFSPPGAITLNSPISSCTTTNGITTCNPQFNIGQNINVKFTLLQGNSPLTTATEQLSIARTSHTVKGGTLVSEFVPQTVVATKNSATLNFFVPNGSGQYSYNVDSSAFDKLPKGTTATYQFTIWGNGATPFPFFTTGTF
jgi:hypothetical protein